MRLHCDNCKRFFFVKGTNRVRMESPEYGRFSVVFFRCSHCRFRYATDIEGVLEYDTAKADIQAAYAELKKLDPESDKIEFENQMKRIRNLHDFATAMKETILGTIVLNKQ